MDLAFEVQHSDRICYERKKSFLPMNIQIAFLAGGGSSFSTRRNSVSSSKHACATARITR